MIVSVTAVFVEHKPLLLGQKGADLLPGHFMLFHQVDHSPSDFVDLAVHGVNIHTVGRAQIVKLHFTLHQLSLNRPGLFRQLQVDFLKAFLLRIR